MRPSPKHIISATKSAQKLIKKRMFAYIAAGLGLVAGLAWNDAIKAIIDYFIPQDGGTLLAKIIYAFTLTIVVSVILVYIEKSLNKE